MITTTTTPQATTKSTAKSKRRPGNLSPLLIPLCFFILYPSPSAQGETFEPNQCYTIKLSKDLRWATTGIWSPGEEALLVSDAFRSNIVNISLRGIVQERDPFQKSQKASARPDVVSTIRQARGETLIEYDQLDLIVSLQSNTEFPIEKHNLFPIEERKPSKEAEGPGEIELIEFWDWVPLGEGYLAFSDIYLDGKPKAAFIYAEHDRYYAYQVYDNYKSEDLYPYFRDTTAYLATLDSKTGYILFLEEKPRIGKVGTDSSDITYLDFFPEDFRQYPSLDKRDPHVHGATQATRDYEKYEKSKMVVSLYAWKGSLYLLTKGERVGTKTPWWLIEIDPQDGSELSRARLPTAAAHLTVIPGDDHWALIEKGPVEAIGELDAPYMPTHEMVLLPASWAAHLDRSPLVAKSIPTCAFMPK